MRLDSIKQAILLFNDAKLVILPDDASPSLPGKVGFLDHLDQPLLKFRENLRCRLFFFFHVGLFRDFNSVYWLNILNFLYN
ncbi:hypothetical protein NMG60_11000795 [Bertholletia excelsa]